MIKRFFTELGVANNLVFDVDRLIDVEALKLSLNDLYHLVSLPFFLLNSENKLLFSVGSDPCLFLEKGENWSTFFDKSNAACCLLSENDEYAEYYHRRLGNFIRMPIQVEDNVLAFGVWGPFLIKGNKNGSQNQNDTQANEDSIAEIPKAPLYFCESDVKRCVFLFSRLITSHINHNLLSKRLEQEILDHDRLKVEFKVQDSYFQNLYENAPDAIVVLDNQDRILQMNKEFIKLFGYSKEEAVGFYINDLIVPDDLKGEGLEATQNVADGNTIDLVTVRKNKHGHLVEVTILGKPILLNNNQIAVYGIYRDISEKVKVERIQKLMFRISEIAGNYVDRNELFRNIYFELNQIIASGEVFIELYEADKKEILHPVPGDDKEEFEKLSVKHTLSSQVIEKSKLLYLEKEQILKIVEEDGIILDRVPDKWLGVPLEIDNKVIGVLGVKSFDGKSLVNLETLRLFEFISSQVAAAIQKNQNEYQLRKLYRSLEQSPTSVLITNLSGEIEYVNPKYCEVSGYSASEILGRNPNILKSGLTLPETYECLWRAISTGKEWNGELLNRKKSGELYWEKVYISPVKDDFGTISHYIGIKEDITQLKKTEKELIEAKDRAEESDQLKSVFLANMSHELRTPLNAVIGFSNLCDESLSKEEILEFVQLINKSGNQLLSVIEDILSISLLESGQGEIRKERFLLENFLLDFKNIAYEKRGNENREDIELFYKPDAGLKKVFVETDSKKLLQVLVNLLKNALKFTEQGHIEYGFMVKGDHLHLYVKDTGVGIPKENHELIFQSFRQGDGSSTRKYGGAGLGLSLSRRVVQLLGGKLWLESELGEGSTFWVSLPCVLSAERIASPQIEISTPAEPTVQPIILVVEDELSNFKLISAILKRGGYEVLRAENGKEAVEMCRENNQIDLVLMDVKMPVMNGFDATMQIRKFKPELPIVAQTAFAMDQDREKALNIGCDSYISKPIKKDKLISIIQDLLKK